MPGEVDYLDIHSGQPLAGPQGVIRIARQGNGLIGSVDGGPYATLLARSTQDQEEANAAYLLNSQALLSFFRPIAVEGATPWAPATVGSGARSYVSGALRLSTGATSASIYQLVAASDGSAFSQGVRAAADWYVSCRFKVNTTPTTGTIIQAGGIEAGGVFKLKIGVDFASNPTNFCVAGSAGSPIDSGVPFDTARHTFRAWRTGGLTYFQVDNRAPVTGTANITADLSPCLRVDNGTAANQEAEFVWYFCAVPAL